MGRLSIRYLHLSSTTVKVVYSNGFFDHVQRSEFFRLLASQEEHNVQRNQLP